MLSIEIDAERSANRSNIVANRWDCLNPKSSVSASADYDQSTQASPQSLQRSNQAGNRCRRVPRSRAFLDDSEDVIRPMPDRQAIPGNSPARPTLPRADSATGSSARRSHWYEAPGKLLADDARDVFDLAESNPLWQEACSPRETSFVVPSRKARLNVALSWTAAVIAPTSESLPNTLRRCAFRSSPI